MDAIEVIKERRSVRKFKSEKVSRELMEEIVELTRFAPSWKNTQIVRWTLVDNPEVINQFANDGVKGFVYNMDTLKNANGVAVLSFVEGKSGKLSKEDPTSDESKKWEIFDAGIACQTFCLASYAKGVSTCVFGVIDESSIAKIVQLPEEETVAALIVYGYEEVHPKAPRRKEVSDILRFV